MGESACDRRFCPECDLAVSCADEACPECGAVIEPPTSRD
ncbi:ribosomal protein S27AE [Halorubrum trapanicum]|uniref:Ribosomal protein S27AE n=1 Tax=Halorubrum trapanicum TaxID=29284 RepID=A0A8J7R6H5_9EURY|nr:ribosomal protein S27AE [Halorubrum trapanicum]